MLKISYAGCLGLSPAILLQFMLKCALHPKIAKNSLKEPFLGGSRSFKVIDVYKSKKPVTIACYDKQQVCTYLQPFSHYTSQ